MKKALKKSALMTGISLGLNYCFNFFVYAIAFYVGSRLVDFQVINPRNDEPYSAGDVLAIYFTVVNGGMSLSMLAPAFKDIFNARLMVGKIFRVIDRIPPIDAESGKGITLTDFVPTTEFKNVCFSYPNKPGAQILKSINLVFEAGKRTALVGESGCGKSTCIQMIERFYDPTSGSITLDGKDLRNLNVQWLRKNISLLKEGYIEFVFHLP